MFILARILLILTVLALAACLVLLGAQFIWLLLIVGIALFHRMRRTRLPNNLISHGSARLADEYDLQKSGNIGGNSGLIIGRMNDARPPPLVPAVVSLVSPWVKSADACEGMLSAAWNRPRKRSSLVRLHDVIHTACFSRTGGGKSASLAAPWLLDCPESALAFWISMARWQRFQRHSGRKRLAIVVCCSIRTIA